MRGLLASTSPRPIYDISIGSAIFTGLTLCPRCHMLKLKSTKFDFGWGTAPDPTRGAYSTPVDPLAGFKEAYV